MKKIFTLLSVVSLSFLANAQTNLVSNPGFENGTTGWTAGTTASYTLPTIATDTPKSGANYAKYTSLTATNGFYQEITVSPNVEYTVGFWYKATGDNSDARIWSVFKDSAGTVVYYKGDSGTTATGSQLDPLRGPYNGYLPVATEWAQHTLTFTAPANAVTFQLALRGYNGGTVSFDDIALVQGPSLGAIDVKDFDKKVKMNTLVSDNLTLIELPYKSTVNIYSVDGKLVSSNRVNSGESINVSKLQKGNYIVTVEDGTNKVSRKIVKK